MFLMQDMRVLVDKAAWRPDDPPDKVCRLVNSSAVQSTMGLFITSEVPLYVAPTNRGFAFLGDFHTLLIYRGISLIINTHPCRITIKSKA